MGDGGLGGGAVDEVGGVGVADLLEEGVGLFEVCGDAFGGVGVGAEDYWDVADLHLPEHDGKGIHFGDGFVES